MRNPKKHHSIINHLVDAFGHMKLHDITVADLTFHDTRHCAGTALSQGGMSLALVGEILGHSNPQTTLRYINATQATVDTARDILERKANG